jgi:hypothetical protein
VSSALTTSIARPSSGVARLEPLTARRPAVAACADDQAEAPAAVGTTGGDRHGRRSVAGGLQHAHRRTEGALTEWLDQPAADTRPSKPRLAAEADVRSCV